MTFAEPEEKRLREACVKSVRGFRVNVLQGRMDHKMRGILIK